jgi:fused signal recognition particle receptor
MSLINKIKCLFSKKISDQIKDKNKENEIVHQKKFDSGLKHSSSKINNAINDIAKNFRKLDQNLIDDIEDALISFDIGTAATKKILSSIIEEIKLQNVADGSLIKQIILDKLFVYYIQDTNINSELNLKKDECNVILVSGVNGVGKTTSIAKIANFLKNIGYTVCLIAADTFRAGAVAQLDE